MGEVLALGVTHYPPLGGQDQDMARILAFYLDDPDVPAEAKDPGRWPERMREEWGADRGTAAAGRHRAALVDGFRAVRQRLDAFAPDAVVIWGDDQFENFHDDLIPAFCVMAYEDLTVQPWRPHTSPGGRTRPPKSFRNVWGEPEDETFAIRGNPQVGRYLADRLLAADFDIAYAYRRLHDHGLAHAFLNSVIYLDYDRTGFDHPIVPFQVNCYGRRVVAARGAFARHADEPTDYDPRSPSPARCFDLGAATARALLDSPWRIALIASSSWSHAFLVDKHWRLYPDVAADRRLFEALRDGDHETWRSYTLDEIEASGQQELLNWFPLAGAVAELGAEVELCDFVETYVFNSDKCFFAAAPISRDS